MDRSFVGQHQINFDAEICHLQSDLQDSGGTAAVVLDARALWDRVQVRSNHNNAIIATANADLDLVTITDSVDAPSLRRTVVI